MATDFADGAYGMAFDAFQESLADGFVAFEALRDYPADNSPMTEDQAAAMDAYWDAQRRRLFDVGKPFDLRADEDEDEPACSFCGTVECAGDCPEYFTAMADDDMDRDDWRDMPRRFQ